MEQHIHFILVSVLMILLPVAVSRNILVPAMIFLSFMVIALPTHVGISTFTLISCGVLAGLLLLSVITGVRKKIFTLHVQEDLKKWRVIARPFALLFIPVDIILDHSVLLYLLGILSLVFILTDLYRLVFRRKLSLFFKKTEVRRFSSMTSFVVAIFIVFLLFPQKVAYLCLAFITIGDMAGKMLGMKYGRKVIAHHRTLEGSLGFLTGAFFAGYILLMLFDISLPMLIFGALCATLAELFSFSIDDNFTVSIITGACLLALQYFRVI